MKPGLIWKGVRFGAIGVSSLVLNAVSQDLARRFLIKELSELPGLGHKMGQLLTLRLGRTDWQEFAPEPVPLTWIKARIEKEAPALASQILEIDPDAELASIGQVHRARLNTGEVVAIKVRYPQVDEQLEEQLDLVMLALRNAPKFISRTMDIEAYQKFFRSFFLEELDYRHEVGSQELFRAAWSGEPAVVIPTPSDALTTGSILVQSFEGSTPLAGLWDLPHEKRLRCATLLSRFFIESLFRTGLVHTDLHPKNWGFRPDTGELVVYDFGATLRLSPATITTLGSLIRGEIVSVRTYVAAYESLGFDHEALLQIQDLLPELTGLFFAPFRTSSTFDFQKWKIQEVAEQLLGDRKWVFRSAGPPWFLMVMRSFNGWIYAMKELRTNPYLAQMLGEPIAHAPLPVRVAPMEAELNSNTHLYVQVKEGGVEVVSLEFPARTVECLEDLMPAEVLAELTREGIDLSKIKKEAISSGLKPQSLFEKLKGARSYKVWLA